MSIDQPRARRKKQSAAGMPDPATAGGPAAPDAQPLLPPALEWAHNPWRLHPLKSALALAICLAVAVLAGAWMNSGLWAIIGFVLVAGTNSVLFIPVRYRLDAEGVTVWFLGAPSQRGWSHYRNAYFHPQLVHLTTLPRPSPLDPFRGHSLLFDPGSSQGTRAMVKAYVQNSLALPK